MKRKPIIGILTWREGRKFAEPGYFRQLIRLGKKLGCRVYLFSPADVSMRKQYVTGYVPDEGKGWVKKRFPLPDVVIDRYRYTPTPAFRRYVAFRKQRAWLYANSRLANKWVVHQVLHRDERIHRWLPETRLYSPANLRRMLTSQPLLYVKPINGTGGRGILRIEQAGGQFLLLGRDKEREIRRFRTKSKTAAERYVSRWVSGQTCLIQQGLHLALIPGRTVDMRLLIQKDETGSWQVTGHGLRIGGVKSATSNLHGGGKAVATLPVLRKSFGAERAEQILHECVQLAHQTCETVENHFGRMMELGLDIGIDTEGNVWLIEVNPKPGRELFQELGQRALYRLAIRRPLLYALHLHRQKTGEGSRP